MKNIEYIALAFFLITLVTCGGYSSLEYGFDAVPGVTGASSIINRDGSATVTVTGTGFVQRCTAIVVNGTSCTSVNVISSTVLECTLPSSSIPLINIVSSNSAACTVGGGVSDYTVFVTKNVYNGNLGGLAGADAECLAAANASTVTRELGTGRTWRAILSDGTTSAKARILMTSGIIKKVDGVTVADNSTDLWDGSLDSAIDRDEDGGYVQVIFTSIVDVWSGSDSSGNKDSSHCNDWRSSSGNDGIIGSSLSKVGYWLKRSSIVNTELECSNTYHLYCINANLSP